MIGHTAYKKSLVLVVRFEPVLLLLCELGGELVDPVGNLLHLEGVLHSKLVIAESTALA